MKTTEGLNKVLFLPKVTKYIHSLSQLMLKLQFNTDELLVSESSISEFSLKLQNTLKIRL